MNRNFLYFAVFAAMGLSPVFSNAQDASESKTTIEEMKPEKNKTPGEDVDELITNKKMRAETGSKSRLSIESALSYWGGTVQDAFGAERPNIAAGASVPTASMITGQISAKYNLNTQNSLMGGVGVAWVAPLSSGLPSSYAGNRKLDAYDPYITYQHLYKWAGIQSAFQFTPTFYTQGTYVNNGYTTNLMVSQNNIYEIGTSGVSLGLYVNAYSTPYFDKSGTVVRDGKPLDLATQQADFGLGIDPFIEYQLTDKVNVRTVFNLWNYDHYVAESRATTFSHEVWVQSVGVGISVTRDVFLYPNIQFLPELMRADMTNVALNTNINLF